MTIRDASMRPVSVVRTPSGVSGRARSSFLATTIAVGWQAIEAQPPIVRARNTATQAIFIAASPQTVYSVRDGWSSRLSGPEEPFQHGHRVCRSGRLVRAGDPTPPSRIPETRRGTPLAPRQRALG